MILVGAVKVGIPEFLNGIGKGVEQHAEKLESEFGDFQKLLVARTLKLKRLGLKCQEVSMILQYGKMENLKNSLLFLSGFV